MIQKKKTPLNLPLFFALASISILLASTLAWSYWGAQTHMANADQLVNSYLFESRHTFQQALLPGQHSFLIKWPLILMVRLLGNTPDAFTILTMLTATATVGLFALFIYTLDHRPLRFGVACLALANILLLVPAAPYASGILPVNFAMITTRNLEYIIFIASIALVIRAKRLKTWEFWVSTGLLALLIASDKLFLTLGVGGAVVCLAFYAFFRNWGMVNLATRWLINSLLAGFFSAVILAIVSALHITTFGGSAASPFVLIHSARMLGLGMFFGASGLLTNFGANPAFDASIIRNIPHIVFDRLTSLSGVGFVVNLVVFCLALWTVIMALKNSFAGHKDTPPASHRLADRLSVLLIFASAVSFAAFVATDHYYVVDARYLTITFFALIISLVTWLRKRTVESRWLYGAGALLAVVTVLSFFGAKTIARQQQAALEPITKRNQAITSILSINKNPVLLADYWRALPVHQLSGNKAPIMPLDSCTEPRGVLSSKAWQPDLTKTSFAYLYSLDKSLTNFPTCTLAQITTKFGRPNRSVLVAGTPDQPTELLLFYDSGINKSPSIHKTVNTVFPVSSADLGSQICVGPTVVQTIAHQDDDLLFMNPALQQDIEAGRCVRTIYLTAGDAGGDAYYWLGREKGAEGAYAKMLGTDDVWVEKTVQLKTGQFVTLAHPRGQTKIQLIFMHLPDGNLTGKGFAANKEESLEKLSSGAIDRISSIDKQSSYSYNELLQSLSELFEIFRPTLIRTQSGVQQGHHIRDHSDHVAVGKITQQAYELFETTVYKNELRIPIEHYMGYPIASLPSNVSDQDLVKKDIAFSAYTKYDSATCSSHQACWAQSNYNKYLPRQYKTER